MLFMTVPTAGTRPELLESLVTNCGLARERIVVVATRPDVRVPEGVVVVSDLGPLNIQRWWNVGIEAAKARGASAVAVVNDDISLTPRTLHDLHHSLLASGAAIASPSRPEYRTGLHRRPLAPYAPRLWGSLWVLSLSTPLRPDERYVWWYGDNDLDIRARKDHGGVVLVSVDYEHLHPGEGTASSEELQEQTDRDGERFERQYARLLRYSRFLTRWKVRLSPRKGRRRANR